MCAVGGGLKSTKKDIHVWEMGGHLCGGEGTKRLFLLIHVCGGGVQHNDGGDGCVGEGLKGSSC